ncbi:exopolyphosphatase [Pontiella sp.]|uniref:Ppx/GppA phosphatase family protein n=1 Tax=Pontiella sp. TaxID=2837462 RepID=UPI003565E35C
MVKRKTTTDAGKATYKLKAVIDLGSTAIRMVVAQIHGDGSIKTLDALSQAVAIGADTFTRGRISRTTINDSVKALRSFSIVLKEYGIDLGADVLAVATSAVREARNRDEFLDRVYMASGINVQVIEGFEVNRLTFLAIRPVLRANAVLRKDRLLVAEVGGGSTELLGLDDARVSFAHTYRMGSFRLRETMDEQQGSEARRLAVLDAEVEAGVRQCRDAVPRDNSKLALLLMGGEARLAAQLILKGLNEGSLAQLKVSDLSKLAEKVLMLDIEQVVRKYRLTLDEAQAFGPALLTYVKLATAFGLKRVYICGVSLRDGLLTEVAAGGAWTDDFVEQILHSVREVGRRYNLDQTHADCVTGIALALFHAMSREHALGYRHEVILTVAAQLHDVGMFIGGSSHHKHSKYIIDNSEIFGLGGEDIKLASLVARYHRGALPRASHLDYGTLPREQRLVVSKLAALLRAADAFDRSHTQAIKTVKVAVLDDEVVVAPERPGEYAAEKRALAAKGKMFEQVYGRTVVLRAKRRQG